MKQKLKVQDPLGGTLNQVIPTFRTLPSPTTYVLCRDSDVANPKVTCSIIYLNHHLCAPAITRGHLLFNWVSVHLPLM